MANEVRTTRYYSCADVIKKLSLRHFKEFSIPKESYFIVA